MKSNILKPIVVLPVCALVALVLAGCLHSDDDDGPQVSMVDLDAARANLAAAEDRVTELNTALATANAALATANTDLGTARSRVTELEGMLADAPTQDAVDAIQAMLDTARGDVTRLEGELTAANGRADMAEAELAEFKRLALDVLTKEAKDERIAREMAINSAIGTNRVGTAAKGTPNNTDDPMSGVTAIMVTRDADGVVMVDVNGDEDDDYTGGEVTAGDGAWNSVMMMKTDATTEATDVLVIYTDIEAPADKLFTAQYPRAVTDEILMPPTGNVPTADLPAHLEKASSPSFPAGNSQSITLGGNSGNPGSFAGMFDGVSGNFVCGSAADEAGCSLVTNDEGELEGSAGWRFTPAASLTDTVKDPDVAYAYFGWWLNKPKENDDTHDVEVFAGGSTMGHEAVIANTIEGNATYQGPAAGKYVTKTFEAGVHSDSGVGHFTATAHLTAKFGADDAAGAIGGRVTNFVLDDTTSASWTVTLEDAFLTTGEATFNGTTEVNFGGDTTDTDPGGAGTWQGSFYGAGATPADDEPSTVAGTFDALTDNASVIGGFGATLQ